MPTHAQLRVPLIWQTTSERLRDDLRADAVGPCRPFNDSTAFCLADQASKGLDHSFDRAMRPIKPLDLISHDATVPTPHLSELMA